MKYWQCEGVKDISEDVIYELSLEVCTGEEALSEDALAALYEEAGGLGAAKGHHGQPEHALGQPREQQLGDRREGEDGLVLWEHSHMMFGFSREGGQVPKGYLVRLLS